MKLVLIQPPVQDFYDTDIRLQPIGLCYLKAAIKKFLPGIDVVVKDFHQGCGRQTVAIPPELSYLKSYYAWPDASPFSAFHQFYHFGKPFDEIVADIAAENTDMVGISSLFSPYYREVLEIAGRLKAKLNIPILVGGSHVSACPEMMLAHPAVDFVIRGEGEKPLVEFLRSWNNGRHFETVPNLGFKRDGRIHMNPLGENFQMDDLPGPDLSDLEIDRYRFEKKPLSFVITSRSCPHRCSFCSVHLTFGTNFRRRKIALVLEEMKARYAEGYRVFDFEDDNLTFYVEEMKSLCRLILEAFPKHDIHLVAMNGISYLSLDSELLGLMKEAGFSHLNLALVSSDTAVRQTTKRPHTIQKYLEVVEAASKLGFKMVSYQILGLPNESLDSMIQTLVFNARLPVLLGASMFYLTPNSPIAKNFPPSGESDIFKARLTAMAIETEHFSRDDIYTLFVTTRIINFLKGFNAESEDARDKLGTELLDRLLKEKILYAATPAGFKPLTRFKFSLFEKVWSSLNRITTPSGKQAVISKNRFLSYNSCT